MQNDTPLKFGVLVFPGFPMMAFGAVIEPLRAANTITGKTLYQWVVVADEPTVVAASNGILISPDHGAKSAPNVDYIVVCSGGDADRLTAQQPLNWIRKNLRKGANIGSVADGAFYLARAGLLDGHACTLHWRSQPAFVEAFPNLKLVRSIYVIDGSRFTSAGGVGAFDMMLDIISRHHGSQLSQEIAEWFVHDRIKDSTDRIRLELRIRTGIRDDLVLDAASLFEMANENATTITEVAKTLGVTVEKLERAFKIELGHGPADYYKRIRLRHARDLLEHSALSVREIGLASGYASFSAFVRAFHAFHGSTPGHIRKLLSRN